MPTAPETGKAVTPGDVRSSKQLPVTKKPK
jgi:hypothetical protein